jgi:hypothetical protein
MAQPKATIDKADKSGTAITFLTIPKEGMAPMLFLEWIASFPGGKAPVYAVINNREDEVFNIRMIATHTTYYAGLNYINQNL